MERKMDTFNTTQKTLIQAMTRLENQFSQQANSISENPKGLYLVNHSQILETLGRPMRLKIQISVIWFIY